MPNSSAARPSGLRVVLATHNPHKVAEFGAIARAVRPDLEVVGYDGPEPIEDGTSFEENALIKARVAAQSTGLVAVADDAGVSIDVLGGGPGIFSAYWAGRAKDDTANWRLLLEQLADIRDPHRRGHYVCVMALVAPGGTELTVRGELTGRVALAGRGDGGFGYDPVMIPDEQPTDAERTVAEWTAEEKNARSARARAFEALAPHLAGL